VLASDSARWERLATLARQGALRAQIERSITLDDVAEAQHAMETGHGRGKIVVRLC
jgi:NADPH:quinone reductase-like Zn-dependent oxidoreductase